MRKLLFIAMIVGAISVFVPARAWASPSHAQVTGPAAVFGSGSLGHQFGNPTVRMQAFQTLGQPFGGFIIAYPDHTFVSGSATCLFVSGKTGYLTGRIFRAVGPRTQANNWSAGNYIIIGVQDNGSAGRDLLNFSSGFAANPGCGPNPAATPVFPITRGHFVVFGGN